jgi:hypothetical protein
MDILRRHDLPFSCVNRVELDRQHLSDVDLVIAVGGDGTVLSAAHFLDHGTSECTLVHVVGFIWHRDTLIPMGLYIDDSTPIEIQYFSEL